MNADDLGWSVGITDGILLAHREGIVTSTTLVANMPDAERAALCVTSLPDLGVGVHLNACQGRPLSPAGVVLADEDGAMRHSGSGLIARCMRHVGTVAAVLGEFEAQIQWVLNHGIRPSHLDSHRHVHAYPPLFSGVVGLARKYAVPWIRWPHEKLRGLGWPRPRCTQASMAKILGILCLMNAAVGRQVRATTGTWGIAHTGYIDAPWLIQAAKTLPEGTTEIMVHPGLADGLNPQETRLLDSRPRELQSLCDPVVKEAFARNCLELIHYGHLRTPLV